MEIRIVHSAYDAYNLIKGRVRYNYIYQFSDLSSDEWKNVICYGLFDGSELKEITMLNINYNIPVLLAANFENNEYNKELIYKIKRFLPPKFYTHIDKYTLQDVFQRDEISDLEEYMNMGLQDKPMFDRNNQDEVIRLWYEDMDIIKGLMDDSYPGAWLDDKSVKMDENFGITADNKLVSFAGLHAYSKEYEVAAVAHVTTHPDYRKKGYCKKVLTSLLNDLSPKIKYIGLNVKSDNFAAVNCYKKLGFKECGRFLTCDIKNNV